MVPQQQGEVNTDPRFIYGDDLNVVAYRLGMVETDLKSMDVKLDRIINEYPTVTMLNLILDPVKKELSNLQTKYEEEAKDKVRDQQQIKYMTYAAVIGPVGTIIIGVLAAFIFGGIPQ